MESRIEYTFLQSQDWDFFLSLKTNHEIKFEPHPQQFFKDEVVNIQVTERDYINSSFCLTYKHLSANESVFSSLLLLLPF